MSKDLEHIRLQDKCIKTNSLGRHIVRYTVGNLALWQCMSRAVKWISDHLPDDIPPHFQYGSSHSKTLLHFFTIKIFVLSQMAALQKICKPQTIIKSISGCKFHT